MVGFVAVTKSSKNFYRVRNIGCFDEHRSETALKRCILFNMLAVLIKSCGANCLKFTSSKHRLEDACRVNCAFSSASAHKCVDFINKKNDVTARANLFKYFLESLFKVATVAATRDQGAQIQGVHLLVLQRLGDFTGHNVLGETLNDRSLTNARLTDQHWIVLGAAGKNLHYALNFFRATNNRIKLVLPGGCREIATELIKDK